MKTGETKTVYLSSDEWIEAIVPLIAKKAELEGRANYDIYVHVSADEIMEVVVTHNGEPLLDVKSVQLHSDTNA